MEGCTGSGGQDAAYRIPAFEPLRLNSDINRNQAVSLCCGNGELTSPA